MHVFAHHFFSLVVGEAILHDRRCQMQVIPCPLPDALLPGVYGHTQVGSGHNSARYQGWDRADGLGHVTGMER